LVSYPIIGFGSALYAWFTAYTWPDLSKSQLIPFPRRN